MTPSELARLIQDAITSEFPDFQPGDEEVYPSQFFNRNVINTAPNGQKVPRNPKLCATNYGAAQIANVLTASGREHLLCSSGLLGPAEGWAFVSGGGYADSEPVPYLQFAQPTETGPFTGPEVNAGLLLDYFLANITDPIRALNGCQLEVLTAFAARLRTHKYSRSKLKPRSSHEAQP